MARAVWFFKQPKPANGGGGGIGVRFLDGAFCTEWSFLLPHPPSDSGMFNASVFVDDPFTMPHQGDITTNVLLGLKKRLGRHVVYMFSEHNPSKPTCGPFDLTVLNPLAGMAKPFGQHAVQLRKVDVIIKGRRAIINENVNDLPFQRAGFNVERRLSFEELDENFRVKKTRKKANAGKADGALDGLGALFET